jgi:hypothetical protein
MADASEATPASDSISIVEAGSVSIPVIVLSACATFLVAITLSVTAVLAEMSMPFVITSASLAVIGGCAILAALVAHNNRKTAEVTRQAIIEAMKNCMTNVTLRLDLVDADVVDIKAAVVRLGDLGSKTTKAITKISTGLTDCKTLISAEVETVKTELEKLRAAQYTLFADNPDTGTDGRRNRPFGVVKN